MAEKQLNPMVNRRELAEMAGVSCATVDRLRQKGLLPAPIRVTERLLRWRRADIETWLESRRAVEPLGAE